MHSSNDLQKPLLARPGAPKGSRETKASEGTFGEGSVASSVVLLCSAAIGTGVLALPYGVSCVGVLPALGLFAFAGSAAYISNVILFRCVKETGIGSYGELMIGILGSHGATVLDGFVCVEGIGAVATCLVFVMDFVPQICSLAGDDVWCTDRTNVVMAASLVIWPLSCFKGLSALRYVSTCSIATMIFTSLVVVAKAPSLFARLGRPLSSVLTEVNVSMNVFQVLTIACFAFMTHTNSPEIALQLRDSRGSTLRKVVGCHTCAMLTVYCAIGICGFLAFLDSISQDFLTNYDVRDLLVVMSRVLLSATLVFACPINLFPAMQAAFNIAERMIESPRSARGGQSVSLYDKHHVRVPAVTAAYALACGIAMRSPHVADLISTLSAFMTAPLMFAFPGLMYIKILRGTGRLVPVGLVLLTVVLWIAEGARLLSPAPP